MSIRTTADANHSLDSQVNAYRHFCQRTAVNAVAEAIAVIGLNSDWTIDQSTADYLARLADMSMDELRVFAAEIVVSKSNVTWPQPAVTVLAARRSYRGMTRGGLIREILADHIA